MKETKKQIYARYGIEYKNNHIRDPYGNWIRELLKDGNTKTGKAVSTYSISTKSCPCHCVGCYAETGMYTCPSVKDSLNRNYDYSLNYLDFVDRAIRAQLETFKPGKEVRIHAAGDFFNDAYAAMWKNIVRDYPHIIFWTYTKAIKYESMFDEFQNGNIVRSIIPGVGINFGHCGYIADAYEKLTSAGVDVHICECGINPDHHCAGCHACSEHKYVLFVEHSTAYKAESDPELSRIKDIIAAQKSEK